MTENKRMVLDLFAQGRGLYTEKRFSEAKAFFMQALAIDKSDGPSAVYLERCEHFEINPPPDDWDGVYTMTHK